VRGLSADEVTRVLTEVAGGLNRACHQRSGGRPTGAGPATAR
jgi:hypothetical protein